MGWNSIGFHGSLHDAKATRVIFTAATPGKSPAADDPAVKTSSVALNKHGDAILHLAYADLQRAAEAQQYASYYEREAKSREAVEMHDQAQALKARGEHRLAQAAYLHRKAKAARTKLERFGPIAWKIFIILSVISMLAGIIGSLTSSRRLEKIQHDAAIAAKKPNSSAG